MNIAIIGSGHVGLVSGACFADLGNNVICMDHDRQKIKLLNQGRVPFFEPGLSELLRKNRDEKRLRFTTSIGEAVKFGKIIFLCVGTPPRSNGESDLSAIEHVAKEIAAALSEHRLIVEKSTVPVQTGAQLEQTIKDHLKKRVPFDVASNQEFLREGSAIHDFFNPDRIVLGVESKRAEKLLTGLYKPLKAPLVVTDIRSAELIKHASNSFLATKISFINLISQVAGRVGADITKVAAGMGMDRRIGSTFLDAGIGFGGSCFPKDLSSFIHIGEKLNVPCDLLKNVVHINEAQKMNFVKRVEEALWNFRGKNVGVLGLAFKPDTDDMRNAPSVDILNRLRDEGVQVCAFDPRAVPAAKKILKGIRFAPNAYEACREADAALVLTEWREFKELDLSRLKRLMRRPVVVDGRNIYDPAVMKKLGFKYYSIGR